MNRRPTSAARRGLTETDRRIWATYVQHVVQRRGATPVADLPAPILPAPIPPPTGATAPPIPPRPAKPRLAPVEIGTAPGGLDRSTWTRLRTGRLAPTRRLDLHGRTLQRAHAELHAFLAQALAEQMRCVEVITGHGRDKGGGAIRRELTHWLNEPGLRPMILAVSHPHPGNTGAVLILLRRKR